MLQNEKLNYVLRQSKEPTPFWQQIVISRDQI